MTGDQYEAGCQTAEQIERDRPRWLIIFGCYSHEFVAFPLFPAPPGTVLVAHYAPALIERMERAEHDYRGIPVRHETGPATQPGGRVVACPGRA